MLFAMATGTGEPYSRVNQSYRPMKSGFARPISQHNSLPAH